MTHEFIGRPYGLLTAHSIDLKVYSKKERSAFNHIDGAGAVPSAESSQYTILFLRERCFYFDFKARTILKSKIR